MSDLNEKVAEVVVVDILCHAGALRLPVEPSAESAVMNVIVFNYNIDRRVELDTANLVGEKFVFDSDVVDFVMLDF